MHTHHKIIMSLAVLGITAAGCETGVDDIEQSQSEYQEAQRDANQLVADAQHDANAQVHETRKIVLEEQAAVSEDVARANRENPNTIHDQRDDLREVNREGADALEDAEQYRQRKVADAEREAQELVNEARQDLEETKQAALKDAQDEVDAREKAVADEEQDVVDAKAEVAAAEARLRNATDDDRASLQEELTKAQAAVTEEEQDVLEAKQELQKARAELDRVKAAAQQPPAK